VGTVGSLLHGAINVTTCGFFECAKYDLKNFKFSFSLANEFSSEALSELLVESALPLDFTYLMTSFCTKNNYFAVPLHTSKLPKFTPVEVIDLNCNAWSDLPILFQQLDSILGKPQFILLDCAIYEKLLRVRQKYTYN
jgi:hypothetical protein